MSDFRHDHPATGMQAARLWFGREVEGSRRGLSTAFIADVLTDGEQARLIDAKCEQWFFTETFTQWHWYAQSIIAHRPHVVTAAVLASCASQMFAIRSHNSALENIEIIVRFFDAPWSRYMRGTDQVSVGVPYNMITFKGAHGYVTEPHEYREDTKWPR